MSNKNNLKCINKKTLEEIIKDLNIDKINNFDIIANKMNTNNNNKSTFDNSNTDVKNRRIYNTKFIR